jgi:FkbM family methyltransferase
MRVAGYVQTPRGQVSHPGLGLARQRERIEEFVAQQGWSLVEIYEDPPGAGHRPALTRLESQLDRLDKVVVVAFDRLRRSVDEALAFVQRLEGAQVDLVCLREGFDTGAADGRGVVRVLEVVAQWQRLADAREGWGGDILRKPGFAPATLIDVGVGPGTGSLYEAFPDAYLVLVEPLAEFEARMSQLVAQRPGEYHLTAAGATAGEAEITVEPGSLVMSSLLAGIGQGSAHAEARRVPVTPLDDLLARHGWTPPFGLKIDTEGYEDRVVDGAGALLEDTQFVLAEVSLVKRFEDSYTFVEFVSLMEARGFHLCDVLHVFRRRRDLDGQYADALFRRSA